MSQGNRFNKKEKVRGKKNIVYNILIAVFLVVFLVSGGILLKDVYFLPKASDDALNEIEEELYAELEILQQEVEEVETDLDLDIESEEPVEEETAYTTSLSDAVLALREKYPDLVGWIKIENTDVHFPVMKSSEDNPEYYLRRNYKGEYIKYGSIFHDAVSDIDTENQILHGHNMLDGRMFACLNDYYDIEFYKQSPTIEYTTYEEEAIWKIVAIFEVKVTDDDYFKYITSEFSTTTTKQAYIDTFLELSVIDTGVDVNVDDYFLTLSTCSSDPSNYRTVVIARKVREGEDATVDTSLATYN